MFRSFVFKYFSTFAIICSFHQCIQNCLIEPQWWKNVKNTAVIHITPSKSNSRWQNLPFLFIILVLKFSYVPSEVNGDALIDRLKTTFVYADFFRNNREFFILKPIRILENFEFEIFKKIYKEHFPIKLTLINKMIF